MKYLLDTNICLDLLDTHRQNSKETAAWYLEVKDDSKNRFFLFSDAITTIFYILTERKGIAKHRVVEALQKLTEEIEPLYFDAGDTRSAFWLFNEGVLDDLEDLLMLQTAHRYGIDLLLTSDKKLLRLKTFEKVKILSPKELIKGKVG